MDAFCSSRNLPSTVYHEPTLQDLYHHLLVDDERKLIFCYVPKVRAASPRCLHVVGSQTRIVGETAWQTTHTLWSRQKTCMVGQPDIISHTNIDRAGMQHETRVLRLGCSLGSRPPQRWNTKADLETSFSIAYNLS